MIIQTKVLQTLKKALKSLQSSCQDIRNMKTKDQKVVQFHLKKIWTNRKNIKKIMKTQKKKMQTIVHLNLIKVIKSILSLYLDTQNMK